MKRLEVFLLPLDGMLVHRRTLPRNFVRFPQQFAGTHLYTWVERGTVRVKCLAQEHSTMFPARARSRTARSGVERTNHEATAPSHKFQIMAETNLDAFIAKDTWFVADWLKRKGLHKLCSLFESIQEPFISSLAGKSVVYHVYIHSFRSITEASEKFPGGGGIWSPGRDLR